MTRDEAATAIAKMNHDPLIRYWSEELAISRRFVDALIVIGVFKPDDGCLAADRPMKSDGTQIVEADRPG